MNADKNKALFELVLSAFIGVYRRPICLFQQPTTPIQSITMPSLIDHRPRIVTLWREDYGAAGERR
jgi:hypothetical protein